MQKPHTDKKFYELGVKEADHNMRLLWSDAPESAYAATEAEEVVKTLSGRFGIYNMHADHGIVIFERWY